MSMSLLSFLLEHMMSSFSMYITMILRGVGGGVGGGGGGGGGGGCCLGQYVRQCFCPKVHCKSRQIHRKEKKMYHVYAQSMQWHTHRRWGGGGAQIFMHFWPKDQNVSNPFTDSLHMHTDHSKGGHIHQLTTVDTRHTSE